MGMIGNAPVAGTIGTGNIQDGGVETADIKDGAVTLAKLAASGTKDSTTFLRGDNTFAVVSVTPTAVSDQANTSTGAFDIPSGTTAQRPASPNLGYLRFNTELDCMENYTATGWLKVSIPVPVVSALSGAAYAGITSTITLSGTQFGVLAGSIRFSSGATTKDVVVTPASASSLSVAVPSEIYGLSTGTVVSIKFTNADGGQSNTVTTTIVGLPTGGNIVTTGGVRVHTFNGTDNFVVPSGFAVPMDFIIVAGGGGGGGRGGGGGAGGYISRTAQTVSPSTYVASVGGGGAGRALNDQTDGGAGVNSSFNGLTAIGGGGGGGFSRDGIAGGSGGGAGRDRAGYPGNGTSGQGNAGGYSGYGVGGGGGCAGGGGGGGASAVGGNGTQGSGTEKGGNGGSGVQSSITGTAVYYAGGGGGGDGCSGSGSQNFGLGGLGGGGNGVCGYTSRQATAGASNTGGGGDFDSYRSANGGSGVVIVRYQIA